MIQHLPYILSQFADPFNLVLLVAGNIIGIIFGAIPGLSGTMAVMLFMPLTYTMESGTAIILLLALWIGGCSGSFIGSVLLGIPGSASAVATCWDGYPMSLKGQSGKALAVGMSASFIGTFFSAIFGAFLCEVVADLAFKLGPWDILGSVLLPSPWCLPSQKATCSKGYPLHRSVFCYRQSGFPQSMPNPDLFLIICTSWAVSE
jgi:putative tricarboxylic transport membrane protein